LCLHILVALGLHLLLIQGRLKQTLFPLLITLLFATAYLASELVLWSHVAGYVFFCGLDVYAVYFFLRYLKSDRNASLAICGVLSLTAEFTYEGGAMVNLLFAVALFARSSFAMSHDLLTHSHRRTDRRFALLFLLAALLLPTASLIDLHARGIEFALHLHGMEASGVLLLAGEAAFRQIGFWLGAWLAPTVYRVFPASRAICLVSAAGLTGLTLVNLAAVALLAAAGFRGFTRLRHSSVSKREPEFAVALCMLFLLGYSMMIAVGRTVPRGFDYLLTNTYYSYIVNLTVCVAVALAAIAGRVGAPAAAIDSRPDPKPTDLSPAPVQTARVTRVGTGLVAALIVLTIINAFGVRSIARQFRYDYAASRQEVVDHVLAWRMRVGDQTQRYFVVSPTCRGNEMIPWFTEARLRRNSGWRPPVTLADALWPDRSANLNAAMIHIPLESVDEIHCAENADRDQTGDAGRQPH
jgi:hypothetical protein